MILVDTSVWIDHFARPLPHLVYLLNQTPVLTHPFVIGELACGAFPGRTENTPVPLARSVADAWYTLAEIRIFRANESASFSRSPPP